MLHSMISSPVMRGFLLLSLCLHAALADVVSVRQTNSALNSLMNCAAYSSIANLSTISSNSTYRAAFLRSTTDGTDKAARILNTAQNELPLLINNQALNQQCGNATAIAITEAANNFTAGVVAEFKIRTAPGVNLTGTDGLAIVFVTIAIVTIMCGTFSAL